MLFKRAEIRSELRIIGTSCFVNELEVPLEEARSKLTQFSESLAELVSTFNNMVGEDVFLSIDPEMVKSFLGAVENLR